MVQVCQGTSTKNDMLHISIDQYKEMFILVRREFEKVTTVSGTSHFSIWLCAGFVY